MIRATLAIAALTLLNSVHAADKSAETPPAVEKLLYGQWHGPLCTGELIINADGSFERQYTPGNREVAGTWEMRWTELPPTLILTGKTAGYANFVGQVWQFKIVELNAETMVCDYPEPFAQRLPYKRVRPSSSAEEDLR